MADESSPAVRQRKKPPADDPKSAPLQQRSTSYESTSPPVVQLRPEIAFCIFFVSHLLAALYHPIQDCDEVFNYWEPTHYLNHGHGFQTWEYAPIYAIRSWTYAGIHALITLVGRPLDIVFGSKVPEFYILRILLGLVCALCETRLYSKIAAMLNPRVAITFLLIMATSPGLFHASIAYLPSSSSMYSTMLGMAAFLDWRGGVRTAQGIFAMCAGAALGWPFAGAMVTPFVLEEFLFASISGDPESRVQLITRIIYGTARTFVAVIIQVVIDSFFYRKLVIVPLNIVLYNIFSTKGPDLYGTESWHFYPRNLFLNFHVWFALALLSAPLVLAQQIFNGKPVTRMNYLRGLTILSPFYLWLAIFTLQPHKEERFMYPAYPSLALNAAVSLHIILADLGSTNPKDIISKIPVQLRLFVILIAVGSALVLSALRTIGTITAYNAPLSIYRPLQHLEAIEADTTVCLGKEWYRFPSQFLLPNQMRARFIKSEFSGLLPGAFHEGGPAEGLGLYPGTWMVPAGMNDGNREDLEKYTELKNCNYLVDSHLPSTLTTELEPYYLADTENWERVKCLPFMDASATGVWGRMLWTPDLPFIPQKYKRVWGDYCLLKKRKRQTKLMDAMPHIENLG